MSQFYDQASLVMIPSGYKAGKVYAQKPLSTDGELTFTRTGDTATRVNSEGLIEKVRTNLLLQSNTFNTTWGSATCTLTSGQSGYDGTNNAWKIAKNQASAQINQSHSSTSLKTFSLYAKADTLNWIALVAASGSIAYFNLSNGATGTTGGSVIKADAESIGNGWYRCSVSSAATTSSVTIYPANGDGDISGTSGSIYIQDAQLESGDIATDYIETTSSAVSVGPTANTPRLNYANGCPSLLLEPQRTNSQPYSEQLDNAAWTQQSATITANAVTSPDGYQNADEITLTATTAFHQLAAVQNVTSGTTYAFSVYAKQGSGTKYFQIAGAGLQAASQSPVFDLQNGVVYTAATKTVCLSADIESVADGWYRCSLIVAATGSAGMTFCFVGSTNAFSGDSFAGNGTDSFYLWGAQVEAGSYATSYIPTLSAAVTRGADACSKTGISSLIGQTEGTLFADFTYDGVANTNIYERIIAIANGLNNRITLLLNISTKELQIVVNDGGSLQLSGVIGGTLFGRHKVAIAYKLNDYAIYVDGVSVYTSNSATVPATTNLFIGCREDGTSTELLSGIVSQALVFKTRLSNSDLATLTSL